tara:strand:- start:669 stop:1904 length:1236 start_codon:yes stop_codon:yes gene_type:complete
MANRQGGFISGSPTTISQASNFSGGNQSAADLKAFAESAVTLGVASGMFSLDEYYNNIKDSNWPNTNPSDVSPTSGGTLTINSLALGSYDYTIKHGNQTVSSFTNGDWFTATEDTRSALIFVNGNLTINSGQVFKPANRKLFTCIYVNGDLTVNGEISMTGRGSNHSATTAQNIKLIADGTYSTVTNPQIPSSGGSGGASTGSGGSSTGNAGSAGTAGGTGGGGAGGLRDNFSSSSVFSGAGASGTSFSGGSGGGGAWGDSGLTSDSATSNGGQGGDGGIQSSRGQGAYGGAGNPDGSQAGSGTQSNADGTGGILIIFCTGTLSGTGDITCDGIQGGYDTSGSTFGNSGGGGSGGGSLTVFYKTDSFSGAISADGGAGGPNGGSCGSGACPGGAGGAGGAGTSRKLSITAS